MGKDACGIDDNANFGNQGFKDVVARQVSIHLPYLVKKYTFAKGCFWEWMMMDSQTDDYGCMLEDGV